MKHFKLLVGALASMLMVVGCSSKSDDVEITPNLTIGTEENVNTAIDRIDVSSNATKRAIRVKSDAAWTLSGATEWCQLSRENGDATSSVGNMVTLNIAANPSGDARTATIVAQSGAEQKSLVVCQAGATVDGSGLNLITASDPATVAKCMGLGWNLGNQLDAWVNEVSNETCWGNKACTQQTMDKVKAAGFSTVRIPITWMGHVGAAPEYKIEEAWMNRVEEIVGYAEKAGLIAIINIHHDGADSKHWLDIKGSASSGVTAENVKAQIKAMWTQIAERFKDKGNFLIFESFNEIHDGGWGWGGNRTDGGKQYKLLNEWNQIFVDAVRATGGNNASRYLGIPGYSTNADLTIKYLAMPKDEAQNRILVAVHNYDPYNFTLECKYNSWGHTAPAYDTNDDYGRKEESITEGFKNLKEKFIDNDIAVYFGEMGCSNRKTEAEREFVRYYLEYFCRAARDYKIAPIYWDNGAVGSGNETSAIFNHATGEYINNSKPFVDAMVKAMTNTSASYTLEAVYKTAPAKK